MGIKDRLKKLEAAEPGINSYHVFVIEPGGKGRDTEGFTPEDRKSYTAADADDNATVHIITVSERKPPGDENGY